jgi:hypothetical protein
VRHLPTLLEAPGEREAMAAHNYRLAREHFGYDALRRIVVGALDALGLPTGR